jgi:Xaa-Pro aminopeptidase
MSPLDLDSHRTNGNPTDIASVPNYSDRRSRTLAAARSAADGIDALVLCDPYDIHYLTGIHEGISWLAVSDRKALGLSRHMLIDEVRAEAPDCEILLPSERSTESPDLEQFFIKELKQLGHETIAVDSARLSARSYIKLNRYADGAGIRIRVFPDLLVHHRAVKDAWEIQTTRKCVSIAEQALREMTEQGASGFIGRTERDIANELGNRMISLGADRQGFPGTGIIVASGPHSASAHHRPGQRLIQIGDPLLIDWGAELSSYRSDSTRTLFIGHVPDFALEAYPVVEAAHQRAVDALRAEARMDEVDRIARDTVISAGYPEFHYGLGHGVGLQIHEAPWIRADSDALLEADMLTTIEPGIYLPGIGGIRIENVFRVTATGSERLGSLPTDLRSMLID